MRESGMTAQRRAEELVLAAFARIDAVALGCAFGVVAGLFVFAATIVLVLKGGEEVGPRLALLAQYFPGFTVTPIGSLIGFGYGAIAGFVTGWFLAALRNFSLAVYLHVIRVRAQMSSIYDVLD